MESDKQMLAANVTKMNIIDVQADAERENLPTSLQIAMGQWFRLCLMQRFQPFAYSDENLQNLLLAHVVVAFHPQVEVIVEGAILEERKQYAHVTRAVRDDVRVPFHLEIDNLYQIRVLYAPRQLNLTQRVPLIFDAVTSYSLQGVLSLRRRALH